MKISRTRLRPCGPPVLADYGREQIRMIEKNCHPSRNTAKRKTTPGGTPHRLLSLSGRLFFGSRGDCNRPGQSALAAVLRSHPCVALSSARGWSSTAEFTGSRLLSAGWDRTGCRKSNMAMSTAKSRSATPRRARPCVPGRGVGRNGLCCAGHTEVQAGHQLRELVNRYYPQMLYLCPAGDEPWFWGGFLENVQKQILTIPNPDEIDRGTIHAIYRQACRFIPESELCDEFFTD